ncbi:MAG: TlpA family protein disulfide reductase [Chloroflexi bacterium]|nr:TlpA family protein disulfide reductase [Chloroflexota bacterium]MQC47952.1 TlpA family protein disulfide reductase [Chloroflexota bacterium]
MSVGHGLPAFDLQVLRGGDGRRAFPAGGLSLICFAKEDCATTRLSMPLLAAAHEAFGGAVEFLTLLQNGEEDLVLGDEYGLAMPLLDDSALHTSFRYDIDTVPTLILADREGHELRRFWGFGRDDWRDLVGHLADLTGVDTPAIDWEAYPESRPGCGSKSVEPGIFERLQADAEGSPIRARRIEIAPHDDVHEFMFDRGLTDGLPVVPPTPERLMRMLSGTKRDPQEVVAIVPPNLAPATVEKVAINAVMAGCKPEYLPVVIAALEAMCTDEYNAHGVFATTMGAVPVLVVNGPIRHRIGMNMGIGALGQGNRANATIGRAVRLVVRNVGGATPAGTERTTLGTPMKFTMCFAEWEERSPWEPLHVERGFAPEDSVVTVFTSTGLSLMVDQTSRTAHALGGSLGMKMEGLHNLKSHGMGDVVLVLPPEHVDTIWRDGWTKDQVRDRIQAASSRPLRELLQDEESGAGVDPARFGPDGPTEEQLAQPVPKFRDARSIHIVVAGSNAGKFSSVFEGWASGPTGSQPVSRKIEEV